MTTFLLVIQIALSTLTVAATFGWMWMAHRRLSRLEKATLANAELTLGTASLHADHLVAMHGVSAASPGAKLIRDVSVTVRRHS